MDFLNKLENISDNVICKEPMSNHTTFKIGGEADYFVSPDTINELKAVIGLCRTENVPYMIIGNGSNMLVSDDGIEGVVIQYFKSFEDVNIEGNMVRAEAGILLSKLSKIVTARGLGGFEFASGIPGTLGGALYMNAGAYGGEMRDVVRSVTYMNEDGQILEAEGDELSFEYRKSLFSEKNFVILEACLELIPDDIENIKAKIADFTMRRTTKQPLEMPSAGSVFKRPEGYFAGTLIEQAGLKGTKIGGAQVSEKHAGFIVNSGDATASDVMALIEHVQSVVRNKFSVELEPEIKLIGR